MWNRVFVLALCSSASAHAEPVLVERVVARVDDRPVYLSEIRQRARVALALQTPAQRATSFRRTHRELLKQRIERELLLLRARREHLTVSAEEVNEALEAIAKSSEIDVPALLVEAARVGFDANAYRREVEQQLLEQRVAYAWGTQRLGPYPTLAAARTTWLARARAGALGETRRQVCIEHWVRW